jgi:hypothetical protein
MVGKIGYYTQDDGEDVTHCYMGAEPPQKQYVLREGDHWELLPDPWSIADMIMDGNPELSGPVRYPPAGVPRAPT